MTGMCLYRQKLLAALVEYAPELSNVEICQALSTGSADYVKPEMEGHLRVNTLFIGANVRRQFGKAGQISCCAALGIHLVVKNKVLPVDVAMIHVRHDEHGFCSLGVESVSPSTADQPGSSLPRSTIRLRGIGRFPSFTSAA